MATPPMPPGVSLQDNIAFGEQSTIAFETRLGVYLLVVLLTGPGSRAVGLQTKEPGI